MRTLGWTTIALVSFLACSPERPIAPATPGPPGADGGTTASGSGPGLFAAADFDRARSVFVAGTTPADDAGACVSRILALIESPAATQALGVFGWPRLPASQLLGPDSWAARSGRRWNGTAEATTPGRTTSFPRAVVDVDGTAMARDLVTGSRASVYGLPSPGSSVTGTIDCNTGVATFPNITNVWLSVGGESCYLVRTVDTGPGCSPSGGTFSVSSGRLGEAVAVSLTDVPLECTTSGSVRASMRFQARLSDRSADRDGLNPALSADGLARVLSLARAGVTLGQLVDMLQPMVPELTEAADECARAADAGATFRVPGVLWAGEDVDATAGDLSVIAGLADLAAGALLIGGAYRAPLELAPLCPASDCVSSVDFAARVNAAVGGLDDSAAITRARPVVTSGLDRLARGLARLDGGSAIERTTASGVGIDATRRWADELHRSVGGAAVTLTDFVPPIRVDASRFFRSPPNPDAIAADPLVVEDGNVVLVEAFFDAFFGASIDLMWGGDGYEGPQLDRLLEAFGDRMSSRGWLLDQ